MSLGGLLGRTSLGSRVVHPLSGCLGAAVELSSAVLGAVEAVLELSWAALGPSWSFMGRLGKVWGFFCWSGGGPEGAGDVPETLVKCQTLRRGSVWHFTEFLAWSGTLGGQSDSSGLRQSADLVMTMV